MLRALLKSDPDCHLYSLIHAVRKVAENSEIIGVYGRETSALIGLCGNMCSCVHFSHNREEGTCFD